MLVVASIAATPGFADSGCAAVHRYPVSGAEWIVRDVPEFPHGDQALRAHAVDPERPDRIWGTNGHSVMRTVDGGCEWREVLRAGPGSEIVRLAASADGHTLLAMQEVGASEVAIAAASGVSIAVSRDGGERWSDFTALAGNGRGGPVAIASSHPGIAYAAVGSVLWRWGEGDWQPAGPVAEPPKTPDLEPVIRRIEIDPFDPNRLYVKGSYSLFVSHDAGESWRRFDRSGDPAGSGLFGPLLARPSASMPASMLLMRGAYPTSPIQEYFESRDGGETFARYDTSRFGGFIGGVPVAGAARAPDDVLVATDQPGGGAAHGVWRLDPATRRFVDVDRYGFGPFNQVHALAGSGSGYSLSSPSTIATYRDRGRPPSFVARELPPLVHIPPFDPPPPPPVPPATLDGIPSRVALEAAATASFGVGVFVPPAPTPIDVFFLVDTSGSQTPSVRGLATGIDDIVRALAEAGIDAQFGLGEFRDVKTLRYRRRADIGPPDRRFQYQLERLHTAGGVEEPHLTALHQVATGSGLPAVGDSLAVPAGQDATWRRGSLRTVILISDEPFGTDPNGPSRDKTIAALRADGARVIGVEIDPPAEAAVFDAAGRTFASTLRRQMEDVARHTGAFAPAGGVDCTGNGTFEVEEGAPMVCSIPVDEAAGVARLADPLVRILSQLADMQTVRLAAMPPDGVTATVDPATGIAGVDVKSASRHAFTVTVGCHPGRSVAAPLRIEAVVAERVRATQHTLVECGAAPPAPVLPGPGPAAALVPPAAAQVQPASPNTPNYMANPGAYGQIQVNPAPRDEHEVQENRQHEFTAVRRSRDPASGLYAAGLVGFSAFAAALCLTARRRLQRELAHAALRR